jgi:multicomponent K+:H+ antiporter subunit A
MVGILPAATVGPCLDVAARAVLGTATPTYSLAVWHGINLPLVMSMLALAGGVAIYMMLQKRLREGMDGTPGIRGLDARRAFEQAMVAISWRLARRLERVVGTQRLQPQVRLLVTAAVLAGFAAAWLRGVGPGNIAPTPVDPAIAALWVVGGGCALGAAWQAKFHRLAAVMLAGGAGLVVVITFVWFSAPDLALTQLTVEIVTTVLLLLGLRWLPKRF